MRDHSSAQHSQRFRATSKGANLSASSDFIERPFRGAHWAIRCASHWRQTSAVAVSRSSEDAGIRPVLTLERRKAGSRVLTNQASRSSRLELWPGECSRVVGFGAGSPRAKLCALSLDALTRITGALRRIALFPGVELFDVVLDDCSLADKCPPSTRSRRLLCDA